MNGIFFQIREEMKRSGCNFRTVAISHLSEVQDAVGKLARDGSLDKQLYEKWSFYFQTNKELPEARTIITAAMPQPINRIRFGWKQREYTADIPPTYFSENDAVIEQTLRNILENAGFKLKRARLAQKTLAVRSGMARYGKNNISYVPGMGSFYRLAAFYTDWLCEEESWREPRPLNACAGCSLCREACPTGCIPEDRFLIHAERCLTHFNESEAPFPAWIQPGWHNALVGCMRCQAACPVNKSFLSRIEVGPCFSEEETALILNGTAVKKLPADTKKKLDRLISEEIYPLMARNLMALIES